MSADFTEKPLTSNTGYAGKLLVLKEDTVRLPNGGTATREYIEHPGAVMVIALFDDGDVLLEHQYRYPVRAHVLELPAGKVEPGEPLLETAQRELLEETGYVAQHWQRLATLHPCVGYSDESVELYLARGLTHVGHPGEADEFIETVKLSLAQALSQAQAGLITEAKTILGLLWAEKINRGEWT